MMNRIILIVFLFIAGAAIAFLIGRVSAKPEFREYMLYMRISDGWGRTSIIDLFDEDCEILKERLFNVLSLDGKHEAAITVDPESYYKSLELDYRAFRRDFSTIQDVRRYGLDLLELRYKKLSNYEWFVGTDLEVEMKERIENIRALVYESESS